LDDDDHGNGDDHGDSDGHGDSNGQDEGGDGDDHGDGDGASGSLRPVAEADSKNLTEMFPNLTSEQLKYVYSLSGLSLSKVIECMLKGPSVESILSLLQKRKI